MTESIWVTPRPDSLSDIVVIGAGPSGCSAAYYAALNGWRVLLVDRYQFPRDKVCGDGISPRSVYLLSQMGLSVADLSAAGAYKVDHFRIFEGSTFVENRPLPSGPGQALHAFGMTRLSLDGLLWQKALSAGAEWCGGFKAYEVKVDIARPGVTVQGWQDGKARILTARLAIIAAGTMACFYRGIGSLPPFKSLGVGLRQYYILKNPPSPTFDLFYEPYLPGGYAWIFPAGEDLVNVGVGVKIGDAKVSLPASLHTFMQENQAVRQILAGAQPAGPPKAAPVRMQISQKLVQDGLIWVGDAAGLAHPMSAHGIPYALESGQLAARTATTALHMDDIRRSALLPYVAEIRNRFST